jgi:hypothetical protein
MFFKFLKLLFSEESNNKVSFKNPKYLLLWHTESSMWLQFIVSKAAFDHENCTESRRNVAFIYRFVKAAKKIE